jgi:hypothetical protein
MRRTWNSRLAYALFILSKYSSRGSKPPGESELERLRQLNDNDDEANLLPADLARAIVAREVSLMIKADSTRMNADVSLAPATH